MQQSKIIVFFVSLIPLFWLVFCALTHKLGANPIEFIIRDLGDWGLRFLLLTLALTPLRLAFKWNSLARYRRMLGLFAFFYIFMHLTAFFTVDLQADFSVLWKEIVKRKFITVGMAAFVILIPLAATSIDRVIKRMGAARWKMLHKLVYPAGILACLHFYWMAKADKAQPLVYAAILSVLLLYRVYMWIKKRHA